MYYTARTEINSQWYRDVWNVFYRVQNFDPLVVESCSRLKCKDINLFWCDMNKKKAGGYLL